MNECMPNGKDRMWVKSAVEWLAERGRLILGAAIWCAVHVLLIFLTPIVVNVPVGTGVIFIVCSAVSVLVTWLVPLGVFSEWHRHKPGLIATGLLVLISLAATSILNIDLVLDGSLNREDVRAYYIVLAALNFILFGFQLFRTRVGVELGRIPAPDRGEPSDAGAPLPYDLRRRADHYRRQGRLRLIIIFPPLLVVLLFLLRLTQSRR